MDLYIIIYIGITLAFLMTFMGGFKDLYISGHKLQISKYHYWNDAKFILLLVIILLLISIDTHMKK